MNDILLLIPQFLCNIKDVFNYLTTNQYLYEKLYNYHYMKVIINKLMENNKCYFNKFKHSKYISYHQQAKNIDYVLKNYDKITALIPTFDRFDKPCYWDIYVNTNYEIYKLLDYIYSYETLSQEHFMYMQTMKQFLKYKFGWRIFIPSNVNDELIKLMDAEYQHYIYIEYYDINKIKNAK